jgi:hypothetical protein
VSERAAQVEAVGLGGVERAAHVEERELVLTGPDDAGSPGRDVLDARNGGELAHGHVRTLAEHFERPLEGGTLRAVATILLVGVDVFFRGKLDVLLAGHKLTTTESIDPPDLVIVDVARMDAEEVAETYPDVPILGFTNHTDTAGLRAAQTAGLDRVVVRSALAERAPQLVEELVP